MAPQTMTFDAFSYRAMVNFSQETSHTDHTPSFFTLHCWMQNEHLRDVRDASPCFICKSMDSFFLDGFPVHLQRCGHVSTGVIAFTPNTLAYYIDDSWNAD
jgi:hypothetical protein